MIGAGRGGRTGVDGTGGHGDGSGGGLGAVGLGIRVGGVGGIGDHPDGAVPVDDDRVVERDITQRARPAGAAGLPHGGDQHRHRHDVDPVDTVAPGYGVVSGVRLACHQCRGGAVSTTMW